MLSLLAKLFGLSRSYNREPHRIPCAVARSPGASRGVTEIAETFENLLRRHRTFVARSGTVAHPTAAQRQPRRMLPTAIFDFLDRHEIGAGQVVFQRSELLGLLIVIIARGPDQFAEAGTPFDSCPAVTLHKLSC